MKNSPAIAGLSGSSNVISEKDGYYLRQTTARLDHADLFGPGANERRDVLTVFSGGSHERSH
jgi:hypothetical protein